MRLMREVRVFPEATPGGETECYNAWAGSPGIDGIATFWVVRAFVEGLVDQRSGYVCNIAELDTMLRETVVPGLRSRTAGSSRKPHELSVALVSTFPEAAANCPQGTLLEQLQLCVSPYLRFTVRREESAMVRLTQSFEFSASHRLHSSSLSEEENRRIFGKCANPNGHGHNYVVEVTVSGEPAEENGTIVGLPVLERVVKERVIDRFDHKHLNLDCAEFRALNPSVENIARVIWELLEGAFDRSRLACIRVWETPKTYAEYAGENGEG